LSTAPSLSIASFGASPFLSGASLEAALFASEASFGEASSDSLGDSTKKDNVIVYVFLKTV